MILLKQIQHLDIQLFSWVFHQPHRPRFNALMRVISRSGDGYLQAIIPLLITLWIPEVGLPLLTIGAIAFVIERASYHWLKGRFKRRRPQALLPSVDSMMPIQEEFSFPSGHTSAAFVLVIIAGHFAPLLALPLLVWAIAVGCSRVFVGAHFPGDVIVGAIIGCIISQCCLTISGYPLIGL